MADLEKMAEQIVALTLKEAKELSDILKDKYGIEPAAGGGVMMAAPAAGEGEADDEPTNFNVVLKEVGGQKIKVIKAIREITGLGLKEAKDLTVDGKVIKENVNTEDGEDIQKKLQEAGASVELVPA